MLTEAEDRHANFSVADEKFRFHEGIKQLINTRDPCSGNTALHWASKYGVRSMFGLFRTKNTLFMYIYIMTEITKF